MTRIQLSKQRFQLSADPTAVTAHQQDLFFNDADFIIRLLYKHSH